MEQQKKTIGQLRAPESSLSEDQKATLDDMPDSAVEYIFSLSPSTIVKTETMQFRRINESGVTLIEFSNDQIFEAIDYLEYLMVNGYRPFIANYKETPQ